MMAPHRDATPTAFASARAAGLTSGPRKSELPAGRRLPPGFKHAVLVRARSWACRRSTSSAWAWIDEWAEEVERRGHAQLGTHRAACSKSRWKAAAARQRDPASLSTRRPPQARAACSIPSSLRTSDAPAFELTARLPFSTTGIPVATMIDAVEDVHRPHPSPPVPMMSSTFIDGQRHRSVEQDRVAEADDLGDRLALRAKAISSSAELRARRLAPHDLSHRPRRLRDSQVVRRTPRRKELQAKSVASYTPGSEDTNHDTPRS